MDFEFHIHDGARPRRQIGQHRSETAARQKAGKLAARLACEVDVQRTYGPDRYITTARPSEHSSAGFRFSQARRS